ncbi:hypothetical protein ANN_21948 [Periplaneta americana]|uniref:Uncharacterized protein n=1 Tax=Periplaneta americana TaxID=6978 RepID=A0ABQ8S6S3_PERAM|nr:hypothetical protein ANN_21948 [Periplaneta americana]
MLNWGRCDYINPCNKDSRAGLAWLRLGAWKGNKIVNEEGERLCPICRENNSYRHIFLQCVELEQVRRRYLPPSMLSQNRSSLACLDLMGNREWEQKTGLFLLKQNPYPLAVDNISSSSSQLQACSDHDVCLRSLAGEASSPKPSLGSEPFEISLPRFIPQEHFQEIKE